MAVQLFGPSTFQFWSNAQTRPKRVFDGILLFGDLMFGGEGYGSFPPFIVKNFSRPGYRQIGYQTSEYQLRSGDYAKIDYPDQSFQTDTLTVRLADVNMGGFGRADTAAHINTSLSMMQKTYGFEETAMAQEEGASNSQYDQFINSYVEGNPKVITILELGSSGEMIGEWRIIRPILTSATFSDITYDGTGFGSIDLRFEYKNFKFFQGYAESELASRMSAASVERRNIISSAVGKWLGLTADISANQIESTYK